jgi:acyl carrier protein
LKEYFIAGIKKALRGLVPEGRLSTLSDDTSFRELGVDSIAMLRLVTQLEEVFQISFAGDELVPEHFRTVAALLRLLAGKKVEVRSDDSSLSS